MNIAGVASFVSAILSYASLILSNFLQARKKARIIVLCVTTAFIVIAVLCGVISYRETGTIFTISNSTIVKGDFNTVISSVHSDNVPEKEIEKEVKKPKSFDESNYNEVGTLKVQCIESYMEVVRASYDLDVPNQNSKNRDTGKSVEIVDSAFNRFEPISSYYYVDYEKPETVLLPTPEIDGSYFIFCDVKYRPGYCAFYYSKRFLFESEQNPTNNVYGLCKLWEFHGLSLDSHFYNRDKIWYGSVFIAHKDISKYKPVRFKILDRNGKPLPEISLYIHYGWGDSFDFDGVVELGTDNYANTIDYARFIPGHYTGIVELQYGSKQGLYWQEFDLPAILDKSPNLDIIELKFDSIDLDAFEDKARAIDDT